MQSVVLSWKPVTSFFDLTHRQKKIVQVRVRVRR